MAPISPPGGHMAMPQMAIPVVGAATLGSPMAAAAGGGAGVAMAGGAPGVWPEMVGAGGGNRPRAQTSSGQAAASAYNSGPCMQSMVGGGVSGGDISTTAAYRQMVAKQAERVEERRAAKGKKGRHAAEGSKESQSSREQAHALAREIAPTYSHSVPEEVELGAQVMGLVGDALRARFGRGSGGGGGGKKEASTATAATTTPDKKGKKKKGSKKKGDRTPSPGASNRGSSMAPSPATANRQASSVASSSAGGPSFGSVSATAEDVPRILSEVLSVLHGHDARCGLPIFLQQVTLINQRLGKASDQRQIEALFGATQVQGYVDFADFLSRESTRAYFAMGMEYAA